LTGSPSLMRRPHQPLLDALNLLGVETDFDGERIRVRSNGSLCGAELYLPSNLSSQFVSALLMIAPRAKSDISIKLPSPLESKHYAEMTVRMQKQFGVFSFVNADFTQFRIYPQRYKPSEISIEGDWSSAAFLLAAGAMSGGVSVSSLNMDSLQPDRRILDALIKMGVNVKIVADTVAVDRRTPLSPLEFDVRDSPDLLPVLSVLCSAADGVSRVSGISRNRLKESDRVKSVCEGLRRCGITVKESEDELTIFGIGNKRGEWGENRTVAIESYNDHRIVMAFAVLGLVLDDGIVIEGADSVTKSFPQFFDTLSFLGACLEILK
ncbi:MAG: hypothetical protein N2234_08550, partial [Planctomycetota bacterium]|nr:hypothetical protein [Planctomycetota bacterium]